MQPDDEVPSPDERVDDMHPGIRQRPIKFGFQEVLDAFHHEIHDGLRCIDDAVCVRDFPQRIPEKTAHRQCSEIAVFERNLCKAGLPAQWRD